MEQKGTHNPLRIRVAADIETDLIRKIDQERKGACSRAAIIRMALVERYRKAGSRTRSVAESAK